ncbi:MAG: hypothetical protein HYV07_28915 [Deltaproteobacteria bacterium]|nr:hypothetical protein [Deltaproteobacteria bacterium]
MSELVSAIETFSDMTVRRHRGQLSGDERAKFSELEAMLRERIDGARPGPRRPGAQAAPANTREAPMPVRADPARPSAPRQMGVELSAKDSKKLQTVAAPTASGYTPPATFLFSDYYGGDIQLAANVKGPLTGVRTADGQAVELSPEARLLYGVTDAPPVLTPVDAAPIPLDLPLTPVSPIPIGAAVPLPIPLPIAAVPLPIPLPIAAPRAPTPAPVAKPPPPSAAASPRAPQAVVHLIEGGHKRGDLIGIEPDAGIVKLSTEDVALSQVLTVFVAPAPGVAPRTSVGQGLVVTLTNGREVSGRSADYAPGVQAMTLVPDQRGKVDYIWVPAWSVKAIRLS